MWIPSTLIRLVFRETLIVSGLSCNESEPSITQKKLTQKTANRDLMEKKFCWMNNYVNFKNNQLLIRL